MELVADALIDEARRQTGLERFDSDSFREGLGILVADLNREAPGERFMQRNHKDIVAALATRLDHLPAEAG